MKSDILEQTILERLLPELEADGYQVIKEPRRSIVPPFLGSYLPDLIALREDGNLAIEVASRTDPSSRKLGDIAKLFEVQRGWKFRVYWASKSDVEEPLRAQSISEIRDTLAQVEALVADGHTSAGFLLSWAIFEAIARRILADRFVRPQTPGRLIETMANEGVLTPSEAHRLRSLVTFRNRFIHGELDVGVTTDEALEFLRILQNLMAIASHPA
jgi:Holliday junction resolvase